MNQEAHVLTSERVHGYSSQLESLHDFKIIYVFLKCAHHVRDVKRVAEQHREKLGSSLLFLRFLLLLTTLVHCSANWLKAELFVSD